MSSHFDEPRVPSKDRCKESPHHGISSLHSSTCSEASSCCNPALACRTCGGQMRSPEEEELGGQSHIFLLYTGKGRPGHTSQEEQGRSCKGKVTLSTPDTRSLFPCNLFLVLPGMCGPARPSQCKLEENGFVPHTPSVDASNV